MMSAEEEPEFFALVHRPHIENENNLGIRISTVMGHAVEHCLQRPSDDVTVHGHTSIAQLQ